MDFRRYLLSLLFNISFSVTDYYYYFFALEFLARNWLGYPGLVFHCLGCTLVDCRPLNLNF